ncbi:hypothetical protein Tco_0639394 [Tanacetum coccineum]
MPTNKNNELMKPQLRQSVHSPNGFADHKKHSNNEDPKSSHDGGSKPSSDDVNKVDEDPRKESKSNDQEKEDNVNCTNNVNAASTNKVNVVGGKKSIELSFDPNMPALEDYSIFDFSRDDEDDGAVADINNLDTTIQVSLILTTRIHKDHPLNQVIGDLQSATQTRKMSKNLEEHGFENSENLKSRIGCSTDYTQREKGLTMMKSFAPVARLEAIRVFIAYASFKGFCGVSNDVKEKCFSLPARRFIEESLGDCLGEALSLLLLALKAEQDSGGRLKKTDGGILFLKTRVVNVSKHINDSLLARGNTLRSDEDRLKLDELMALCTTLQNMVLDLEKTKTTQHNEIASLKRRVKKLENKYRSRTHKMKRLYTVGLTARVESYDNEESLDEEMFDVNVLYGEEVFVAGQEVAANKQYDEVNVVEEVAEVSAAGNVISIVGDATTVSAATTTTATITTVDDITLAQVLMEIKSIKPKEKGVVIQELAEFDDEERLAREKAKKEKEANIALIETWDDIQAKIDADHQLAKNCKHKNKKSCLLKKRLHYFNNS